MAKKKRKSQAGKPELAPPELTLKERKLAQALIAGKNRHQAALAAGYSNPSTAYLKLAPDGYGTGRGANFRAHFMALMDAMGLTDEALLQPIKDGIKAKTPKWNMRTRKWDRFVDSTTRLHASEMGLKLRGRFPEREEKGPLLAVNIITNLDTPDGYGEEPEEPFIVTALAGGNEEGQEQDSDSS